MLTVWKRHSKSCLDSKETQKALAKLPADQHRYYHACQCACHIEGIHPKTKEYIRQSLKVTSWEAATKLKEQMENGTEREAAARAVTLESALTKWIAEKESCLVGASTIKGIYGAFVSAVETFAKARGIVLLSQMDKDACYELLENPSWAKWGPGTRRRQMTNLTAFFKFAQHRWSLTENPSLGIRRPPSTDGKVEPFTPEQSDRLNEAFDSWTEKITNLKDGLWSNKPATLRCLKNVLSETGLRISDAQRVRPAVIRVLPSGDGECTMEQIKLTGPHGQDDPDVTVYLTPETIAEMKSVPWLSAKYPFMLECDKEDDHTALRAHLKRGTRKIWGAMQQVGKVAGVKGCRPHRFRHTFAVRMLEQKWPLEKVQQFMGHKDIATTAKFYAKWNKERQRQLREEVIGRREADRKTLQFPAQERKVG